MTRVTVERGSMKLTVPYQVGRVTAQLGQLIRDIIVHHSPEDDAIIAGRVAQLAPVVYSFF